MKIKKLRVYVRDVAVNVFYDKNIDLKKIKQAVIIILGFPACPGISAIESLCISLGYIVFQPHMKGTFDSAGRFSPFTVKESLRAVNNLVRNAVGSIEPNGKLENMPWRINATILIGHSFGGVLALRYFSEIDGIKSMIFTSPVLHYSSQYGCKEIGIEHYKEVGRKYPFTYRLSPVMAWKDILEGTDNIPKDRLGYVNKVAILYGDEDDYFDIEIVRQTVIDLVKSYLKTNICILKVIKGAGHHISELLDDEEAIELIGEICQ